MVGVAVARVNPREVRDIPWLTTRNMRDSKRKRARHCQAFNLATPYCAVDQPVLALLIAALAATLLALLRIAIALLIRIVLVGFAITALLILLVLLITLRLAALLTWVLFVCHGTSPCSVSFSVERKNARAGGRVPASAGP
jgi:small-conductance mechanosensitive channel